MSVALNQGVQGGLPIQPGVQQVQGGPGAQGGQVNNLVQANNPVPQGLQGPPVAQGPGVNQLTPTQTRVQQFSQSKNQWMLSSNNFARRVADFFQRKFTSDGAFKLSTNTVSSGMAKSNVDAHGGDLTKISGSPTEQTGIDTGAEVIGIMNLAGEVLAYQALKEQDQGAKTKIQNYEQAKTTFEQRTQQEADAQQVLNDARQALIVKQNRLPVVQGEITLKDPLLQSLQLSQQNLTNANQTLANAQATLLTAQQLPQAQQPNAQQMQQLRDDVNNATAALQNLRAQDPNLNPAQHPNLQQEIHDLTGELGQLRSEAQTLNADIQTLNDPNPATQGSIAKFNADHVQAGLDLAMAKDAKDKLEATGALGKATKVEGTQKAYSIGQLSQKSGAVAAGVVKMTSDSIGVVQGASTTFMSAAGVAATGVGALSLPLDCYSLHRDRLAIQGAKSTLAKVKLAERNPGLNLDATDKAFMKMMKRKLPIADKQFSAAYNSTKILAGLGGATAVGFKIAVLAGCSVAAVTAGAACLTPIGWALAGVAAATLIGYGIFKLSRFIHSKRQQKAYVETVNAPNPLITAKGRNILGKMADEHIQLNPNLNRNKTEAQYRSEVVQLISTSPGIEDRVRERAELGLISRSRGYGVELMTNRLRQEPHPPVGPTRQLLTALGVPPDDLQKIVDSNNVGDARKLLGKRLRVS
jgi:hypothetical protein